MCVQILCACVSACVIVFCPQNPSEDPEASCYEEYQLALSSAPLKYCLGITVRGRNAGLYGGIGAVVSGFVDARDGGLSSARLCGVIQVGDWLARVGRVDVSREYANEVAILLAERHRGLTLISLRRQTAAAAATGAGPRVGVGGDGGIADIGGGGGGGGGHGHCATHT